MRFAALNYHVVTEHPGNQYEVATTAFETQLRELKNRGYVAESAEQLKARIDTRATFPDLYVLITIDDGDISSLPIADALNRYGFNATFYVVRDKTKRSHHTLGERDIRYLRSGGFCFGSHGVTHARLSAMRRTEYMMELRDSKAWLQDVLGQDVTHFAPPGGAFHRAIVHSAFAVGYSTFATCEEKMNDTHTLVIPALLHRVNIRSHFSIETFRHAISGHHGFYWRRWIRRGLLLTPKWLQAGREYSGSVWHSFRS